MKCRITFILVAFVLVAAFAAVGASPKPDFSGTWELDQVQSHSIPPDMKQTMTVVHNGDKVTVETKIINAQGERVVKDEFVLDGKEVDFTPPPPANPNAPPSKGKRKGAWLPNGSGFYLDELIQSKNQQGADVTTPVSRKWVMWPDGTMSIETITDTPRGTFNNKRVFVKKK